MRRVRVRQHWLGGWFWGWADRPRFVGGWFATWQECMEAALRKAGKHA